MSFRHNSTGIDPDSSILLLPDGWFTLKIFEAEEMKSKNGNDMVRVKCNVVNNPEYKEATLWHWIVFLPQEQKGAGISVQFRKAIGVPYGGDDIVDSDDWVGKRFEGHVIQETYEKKTRNKIESVRSINREAVSVGTDGEKITVGADDDEVPF